MEQAEASLALALGAVVRLGAGARVVEVAALADYGQDPMAALHS
jgi:hypothetical protein